LQGDIRRANQSCQEYLKQNNTEGYKMKVIKHYMRKKPHSSKKVRVDGYQKAGKRKAPAK